MRARTVDQALAGGGEASDPARVQRHEPEKLIGAEPRARRPTQVVVGELLGLPLEGEAWRLADCRWSYLAEVVTFDEGIVLGCNLARHLP